MAELDLIAPGPLTGVTAHPLAPLGPDPVSAIPAEKEDADPLSKSGEETQEQGHDPAEVGAPGEEDQILCDFLQLQLPTGASLALSLHSCSLLTSQQGCWNTAATTSKSQVPYLVPQLLHKDSLSPAQLPLFIASLKGLILMYLLSSTHPM